MRMHTHSAVRALVVFWVLAMAVPVPSAQNSGEAFRDCPDCPAMVVIPPGTFVMGSPDDEADRETNEGPQRKVTLEYAFALGQTEVTVGQFGHFVKKTGYEAASDCPNLVAQRTGAPVTPGSWSSPSYSQTDNHPVACVTRKDALAYITWLSRRTGETYRLPSEAEWEYAARAGGRVPVGRADTVCHTANVADESMKRDVPVWPDRFAACDDGYGFGTAPVASYAPNAFGLYDMAGNLWEFTQDCYAETYPEDGPTDGSAYEVPDCPRRTVRGGGWLNGIGSEGGVAEHRPANRGRNSPGAHFDSMGFRVARYLSR